MLYTNVAGSYNESTSWITLKIPLDDANVLPDKTKHIPVDCLPLLEVVYDGDVITLVFGSIVQYVVEFVNVYGEDNQRNYFFFHDYEYVLDVQRQSKYLKETKDLREGLVESFNWYVNNQDKIKPKEYIKYIDENIMKK